MSNLEQKNNESEKEEVTETAVANSEETVTEEPEAEEAVEEHTEEAKATVKVEEPEAVDASEQKEEQVEESAEAGTQSADTEAEAEETEEVAETEDADEVVTEQTLAEASEETDETGEDAEEAPDTLEYYQSILERAKELVVQTDWTFVTTELANLAQNIAEGPDTSSDETKALIETFEELREEFEQKKQAHYDELNKKKAENLEKKKELLESLTEIISEKKWTATQQVNQIKGKWESVKLLPREEGEALDERFKELIGEFEDHKVDRLVKKLQKEEENLELKLLVLDKMEALIPKLEEKGIDFSELNDRFNKLLTQWRKIGRVPSDKNQALWDRYNAAQDKFNEVRFKHDKQYRNQIEKALSKKKKLVKQAEALVDKENIAKAARKVNKLHKAWKKAGNLPQKEENEMWDKFKAATDAFNDKKSENIDVLREQEEKNLEKKFKLIEKAGEVKGTDDFDQGHKEMQNLMDQWKKIGPVPRKKSSKIWKKFKGEMDEFYDRRREFFKSRRKDQKKNLEKKKEILKKLEELGSHEDPAAAVEEAKKLQAEFKDIGYVPIKMKNKVWKEYREACDVIYERYRALGSDLGRERKLASQGVDPSARKEIIKHERKASKLKKEISSLESEVIQYEEAKTYFKPTNKGNKLRDELQEKIDKASSAVEKKKDQLYESYKKIDQLKDAGEPEEEATDEEE
ncbi:MAG: DUF349 domain-containing protein [Balneolaceae bacterium]|nr:DUF349 domain-containing protein [Balneolaceae bacterium]